jgi:uncharacterized protein involved in exopolysaccharide biosynthesis
MNDVTHEVRELRPVPARPAAIAEQQLSGWPYFFRLVRVYRIMILAICAAFAVTAVIYSLLATPIFRAEAVVTVVRPDTGGGAMSLASDIAGVMGVDLMQQNGEIETANAVLTSRHVIAEFITRNGLLPLLGTPGKKPLTMWFAVKHFRDDIVTIHNDTKKGVTIIAVEWKDPVVAAKWANGFVALVNEMIRTHALDESRRNITYLDAQLAQTNDLEVKRAMYSLIESETKKSMLANGKVEYAFQIVDPAVTPEVRAHPKRTLIVMVATVLGLLTGIGIAFFRDVRRRERLAPADA